MRTNSDVTAVAGPERKSRRRTVAGMAATAVAVAAAIGGSALLFAPGGGGTVASGADVPEGRRLVGIGHAAIAVPEGWGTNATHCGVPQKDTVVIDVGGVDGCLPEYPAAVESVELRTGEPEWGEGAAVSDVENDGLTARRSATVCADAYGQTTVCRATVYLPEHDVAFAAASSTGAAEVDEMLAWIRVVHDRVAVPGHQVISAENQEKGQVTYLEALEEAGLEAEVVTRKTAGMPGGFVLDAAPAPGTMLTPGESVTVTVAAPPEGPADELQVGMNSANAKGEYGRDLSDEEVRAGATLRLGVGDSIWAYAAGKREDTLAGELDGESLALSTWEEDPNAGHSWSAVRPGTTTITLTITADGTPVRLGTVTVSSAEKPRPNEWAVRIVRAAG